MKADGDCIIVACNRVLDEDNLLFCYSMVAGQGDLLGQRILHAWCEMQDLVFDSSNGNRVIMRKDKYYELAKIQDGDVTRQTQKEIRELMLKTKTYGGWIK